jgi:GntR family transcriptional repressor for pyruvate dehydrogenase complex
MEIRGALSNRGLRHVRRDADATSMKISALGRTPQLPVRVAAAIAAEIAEERLKVGDRLPTEHSLAEKFGVSRNVVREAIAQLRSDGVVQSRQGVGAFVINKSKTALLRIDAELMSDRLVFRNVFELRAILEIQAASLAARRADEAQIADIASALARMRTAESWAEGGVSADLDFHYAVAKSTGNEYVAMVVRFLTGQMRQSIKFMRQNLSDVDGRLVDISIAEHVAIYDAILSRSPAAAGDAMRRHIGNAAHRLGYDLADYADVSIIAASN